MNLPGGNRARLGIRIACVSVSAGALWVILRRVDPHSLAEVLRQMKPGWFLLAGLLFGLALALAAGRWHLVLRNSRMAVHPQATVRTVLIGHFLNTLLFGPAGGDIAKSALYARWFNFPMSSVMATCFLDRLLGGAGFLLFVALIPGLALYSTSRSDGPELFALPQPGWSAAILVPLALAALVLLRRRFQGASALRRMGEAFVTGARELLVNPKRALASLVLSFFSHAAMSALLLVCLQAVAQRPFSIPELLWTFPVISLITAVPVTFAGAGLREGAALVLLGMYGIPEADAVAASLLVFTIYLAWAALAGLMLFVEEARQRSRPQAAPPEKLSVIIPTLNEAEALTETILRAQRIQQVHEIIVADGGSSDRTTAIARELGCCVIESARGRGAQMRAGAAAATGDVVVLLHADTWLPPGAGDAIVQCLRDTTIVGGGFWKTFRERKLLMSGSRARCALRLCFFRRFLGDQVIFARRKVLEKAGGVPDMPLMEEFELCRRLRRHGRLAMASATVISSARRFEKFGVLPTYWRMWRVTAQYYLGTPTQKLARLYEKD
jgi:rSAM/selenodomain-associated transferase 2